MNKKPLKKIGFIGHQGHGKTTLSHAILMKAISKGAKVYSACDPEIAQDGRKMIERMRKMEELWDDVQKDRDKGLL